MFDILDDWEGETASFDIPLGPCDPSAVAAVFKNPTFLAGEMPGMTAEDREWVAQAISTPAIQATPPTPAAQAALERHLSKFDFAVPGNKDQWQSYVMYKYFELTLDTDPKVSKPALDALAKTNVVGLHTEVQEININTKSTVELESELLGLVSGVLRRQNEKVIEGEVV